MTERWQQQIHIEIAQKAIDALADALPLSRQQIKQAMNKGAVWHQRGKPVKRLRRASRELQPGDQLYIYYDADVLASEPAEARLIDDRGDFSVWFKPRSLLSQGSKYGDHCTLVRWAETHLQPQRNGFIVHRLDRAAAGLMLIAHGRGAAAQLSQMFHNRQLNKSYRAIVHGHWLTQRRIEQPLDDKNAISEVTPRQYDNQQDLSFLQINIETGRKHQIRRHLASQGHPIVGDRLYGDISGIATDKPVPDLQLTSTELSFVCPFSNEPLHYVLPENLQLTWPMA